MYRLELTDYFKLINFILFLLIKYPIPVAQKKIIYLKLKIMFLSSKNMYILCLKIEHVYNLKSVKLFLF